MRIFDTIMDRKHRSEIVILVTSLIVTGSSFSFYLGIKDSPNSEFITIARLIHSLLAVGVFMSALIMRKNWSQTKAKWLFLTLVLPLYIIAWSTNDTFIKNKIPWVIFSDFNFRFLALAVLVPASYMLNFWLIIGFLIEVFVLWMKFKVVDGVSGLHSSELSTSVAAAIISILLLFFRYQDEKMLNKLTEEKTRNEYTKSLARVLLTMRDRSNTYLQNLIFIWHVFKKTNPVDTNRSQAFEKAIKGILDNNKQFDRLDSLIDWEGKNLMSDEEVVKWLHKVELDARQKNSMHNQNNKEISQ